jgi:hypothetical protein
MAQSTIESMLKDTLSFFEEFTNFEPNSKGYGLTSDHTLQPERASIAASGFMMCHLILKHHYFDFPKEEVKKIALNSIETLLNMIHYKGFLPHFINRTTGERLTKTEFSTIDTMLCLMELLIPMKL